MGEALGDRVGPVGVEELGRGGAVREAEAVAGDPVPIRHPPVEIRIGGIERLSCDADALGITLAVRTQRVEDDRLLRCGDVIVEEPVPEPDLECRDRIGGEQGDRAGVTNPQMLDDDRRLDDWSALVDEQGKLADRPHRPQFVHRCRIVGAEDAAFEGRAVLVEGDQHLLAVGRERVEKERQHGRPQSSRAKEPVATAPAGA